MPTPPTERVFVSDDFTIQLRCARAPRWPGSRSTGFTVLFLLDGTLRWRGEGPAPANQESNAPAVLLVAPGESLEARGSRAETVSLSLSPAYLLDCALRSRLTRDDARITFKSAHHALNVRA